MAQQPVMSITTALEPDVLLFDRMRASEEMSRLFEYEIDLLSDKPDVDLDELLGKPMTVKLELADGNIRYFNGLCSRISEGGRNGRYYSCRAMVRPWLWFLTRTRNCRIFQDKTVPEIIKEVFAFHSIADFKDELTESYTPWTYCVQYNESDFAFVSRLMEQEGIYYYFKHADGKHTLVLADSYSAHSPCYDDDLPFIPPQERVRPDREHVAEWLVSRELRPGRYALAAYDFEKPSVDLQVKSKIKRTHALADYEVFEYGGDYVDRGDGETYARIRIEEQQAKHERIKGETNARNLAPGYLFKLACHPRGDQNAEYLVIAAEYQLQVGQYEAKDAGPAQYSCKFTALNSQHPFRAERLTQKPVVAGPQTAVVVGDADIDPDKFGRVRVHFYWDRYGKRAATDSCWIRVSQNWGGKGWGGMFIPHVGQEVIVQFEGGDPDLPIITGRVYNAEQMPPVELPAGKTKSIIRDHGSNEIVMEGEEGKQRITMYSPHAGSKFSMGAPNSPTPGFFFTTSAQWDSFVGANSSKVVTGDSLSICKATSSTYVWGNNISVVQGFNSATTCGSSITKILGSETTVTVGAKNELLCAVNSKLTAGALIEINQAVTLLKVLEDSILAGAGNRKMASLRQKVGSAVSNIASSKTKIGAYIAKIGSLNEKIDSLVGNYGTAAIQARSACSIKGAPISMHSKGQMPIRASLIKLDAPTTKMTGDVIISGSSLTVGSSIVVNR